MITGKMKIGWQQDSLIQRAHQCSVDTELIKTVLTNKR